MEDINHNSIMLALGELKHAAEGTNKRLDTLNGSVAKHADKLNAQDVFNAQVTLTQAQIVSDQKTMKDSEKINTDFILKTQGSINTFKWLFGFVGIGTLITLLKVLGFITYLK